MQRIRYAVVTISLMLALCLPVIASAHPHIVERNGQELANGQNHEPYSSDGETCGGDPAVYGLETAHHGPDSGQSGKADGCYRLDSMPPESDDQNPAIN